MILRSAVICKCIFVHLLNLLFCSISLSKNAFNLVLLHYFSSLFTSCKEAVPASFNKRKIWQQCANISVCVSALRISSVVFNSNDDCLLRRILFLPDIIIKCWVEKKLSLLVAFLSHRYLMRHERCGVIGLLARGVLWEVSSLAEVFNWYCWTPLHPLLGVTCFCQVPCALY